MAAPSEISSSHMLYITDDVISKTQTDLVDTGELDGSVLYQLESIWKTKMIQAGLFNGTIVTPPIRRTPTQIQPQVPVIAHNAQIPSSTNQSMEPVGTVKRERRDGFFIPQQDGATSYEALEEDEDDELWSLDDDEEVAATDDDDTNIPHLVMCQFTKVKRNRNKWVCSLKSGVMQINGKNIFFDEANGDFDF